MKNTLQDLRNHLFGILEGLTDTNPDPDTPPPDKEKIKLAVSVSQTIINSAKVEVEYARAIGHTKNANTFFEVKQLN